MPLSTLAALAPEEALDLVENAHVSLLWWDGNAVRRLHRWWRTPSGPRIARYVFGDRRRGRGRGGIVTGPLEGIKVLDMTQVIAGPLACMLLSDLGAEVVKIEPPGIGDLTRLAQFAKGGVNSSVVNNNRGRSRSRSTSSTRAAATWCCR
ncbi:MAG: CoA transferase [Acidimicrobiales bacterium]